VSWIKEVSNSQYTGKQGTAFVKSIPRLELPHFSGDLLEWPQFISLFNCLVRDQPLPDAQRMTYLQRALTGNAKKAVRGMLNHGHLYQEALAVLEEQFGNEELVAWAFVKTILAHPNGCRGRHSTTSFILQHVTHCCRHNGEFGIPTRFGVINQHSSCVAEVARAFKGERKIEDWGERKIEMHPTIPTNGDVRDYAPNR